MAAANLTRMIAIVPAVPSRLSKNSGTAKCWVVSGRLVQLPFAVVPLVQFTSDRAKMGAHVSPTWLKLLAVAISATIIALNVKLLLAFL